jgi:GNAT superfamily N-acetyltransferase
VRQPALDLTTARRLLAGEISLQYIASTSLGEPHDDGVSTWSITATTLVDLADVPDGVEFEVEREAEDSDAHVLLLRMRGVTLNLLEMGERPAVWLDDTSQDLAHFVPLFDGVGLSRRVNDLVEDSVFIDHVTIIDRAHLEQQWRGHGLGRLLIDSAFERHFPVTGLFALQPHPTDLPEHIWSDEEHPRFTRALRNVRRSWASLGFRPLTENLYIKDPASAAGDRHARNLRKKLLPSRKDYLP